MYEIFCRLFYLRPLLETDVEEIHSIWTNGHVRKYLFDDEVISRGQTAEEIRRGLASFEKEGLGLWAVFLEDQMELIGFTGYRYFHDPPELQLLYGLLPEFCGKGYATALAKIMIKYGFEYAHLDEVVASADAPNVASLRVMEKAGMQFDTQAIVNGLDTVYYKISRHDYKPKDIEFTVKIETGSSEKDPSG